MNKDNCSCSIEKHMLCAGRVPIFSALDKQELNEVVMLITQKKYKKDTIIIAEGMVPQDFLIVSKGKIKIYGHSQDGKEQIMYILTDGDFFGARNLLQEREADFNAQAMEDTTVCTIERNNFQKLMTSYPGICFKIMDVLCQRLEKMEALVKKISPKDIEARIGIMLLELAQKYGRRISEGIMIELPMSREEMANYIGVARETISRKLGLLKEEGIIDIVGTKKIIIKNEAALEKAL